MFDLYNTLTNAANYHPYLYHYTNLCALKCILSNKSLRLSRLDIVNDSEENKRITSLWNSKLFVLCFTYDLNNQEYFFQKYGKIRLAFDKDAVDFDNIYFNPELTHKFVFGKETNLNYHSYSSASDWCVYDKTLADVFYTDNMDDHIAEDGFESNAGLIKFKKGLDNKNECRNWEQERETRLRVALRPIGPENVLCGSRIVQPTPDFKYVYIKKPIIKTITISPQVPAQEREKTYEFLAQHNLSAICDIH